MNEILNSLIESSQEIIKNDRKQTIEIVFKVIEEFLSIAKLPVNADYDEINFYQYSVYPIMEFVETMKIVKSNLAEGIVEFHLMQFIYNYITYLSYNNYRTIQFTNIFWPHNNKKFTFRTYEAPARLNQNIKMQYIHPKYSLEDVYAKIYCPEYFENADELHIRKNQLTQFWKKIDNFQIVEQEIKLHFGKYQNIFVDIVGKLFISSHYDGNVPTFIGSEATINQATTLLKAKFSNLTVVRNSSKSFFDPRTVNHMFKIDNMILGRVWQLLDQEVIPVLPFEKSKSHIAVSIRLALTEHITYEILGFEQLAKDKLSLFSSLLSAEKSLKKRGMYTKITECKFIGLYYPIEKYISTMRTNEVVEYYNKKSSQA